MLAEYTGAKHAVAVVNGTAALHIALKLAGVQSEDEVLVPALSFVATANAVAHCGAVPHFVDSSLDTMGMDPIALSEYLVTTAELTPQGLRNHHTGRRIAAIVPMHTYGHPVDMVSLMEIANRYKLPVVEDAKSRWAAAIRAGTPAPSANWACSVSTVTRSSPQAAAAPS